MVLQFAALRFSSQQFKFDYSAVILQETPVIAWYYM